MLVGLSLINQPFWDILGTPIYGNNHMWEILGNDIPGK
jgi:hypothetical protein